MKERKGWTTLHFPHLHQVKVLSKDETSLPRIRFYESRPETLGYNITAYFGHMGLQYSYVGDWRDEIDALNDDVDEIVKLFSSLTADFHIQSEVALTADEFSQHEAPCDN